MVATVDGTRWAMLIERDESERAQAMCAYLEPVLALAQPDFERAIGEIVAAEYDLDDVALRSFTLSRLRAWAQIAATNVGAAQRLARGYDAIFDSANADVAMRRARIVQGVARTELSTEELDALFEVIPSFLQQVPRLRPSFVAHARPVSAWRRWQFWKRGTANA